MYKELRSIIANLNLYYKRICTAFMGQYPASMGTDLYCMPEELYTQILMKSCRGVEDRFTLDEVHEAVKKYQKPTDHISEYYESLFTDSPVAYISVTETSSKEEVVHTGIYLISGFLLVHGKLFFERFFEHIKPNKCYIKMIYFLMFGIKPEETATAVSCLEEICNGSKEELENDEIRHHLSTFLEAFFKHADEIMVGDQLWQRNMQQNSQILKQRIDYIVYEYCKSQGKLPLHLFRE